MRSDRQTMAIALFSMTALLLASAPAGATIYNEVRITDNMYNDENPSIGGDRIVWQGWDKFDYEIYCYDIITGQTTEITHNVLYDDVRPRTDGEYITWLQQEPGENYHALYLHEIATGETTLVVEDPSGSSRDGGIVAWIEEGAGSDELFVYDASTGETNQVTDDSLRDGYARVSQGRVVWMKSSPSLPNAKTLFVYDVSTGETGELFSTEETLYDFDFRGNLVVWWQETAVIDNWLYGKVHAHDLTTGETLVLTDTQITGVSVTAGDTGVFWTDGEWVTFDEWETRLFHWDSLSGQTRVVNDSRQSGMHVDYRHTQGTHVVWSGVVFQDEEIYHHDLATGVTTQVTYDFFTDEYAQVYEGTIVWQGYDPGSQRYEIYMGGPCLDGDGDGFEDGTCGGADCDDGDPAVYPVAPGEVPGDGVDTNCNGADDCFIATAAFGSPTDRRIEVLRSFRDKVLLGHPAGEALTATYYKYSPPMAEAIADRDWMRSLIRALLLPVVGFALIFV